MMIIKIFFISIQFSYRVVQSAYNTLAVTKKIYIYKANKS